MSNGPVFHLGTQTPQRNGHSLLDTDSCSEMCVSLLQLLPPALWSRSDPDIAVKRIRRNGVCFRARNTYFVAPEWVQVCTRSRSDSGGAARSYRRANNQRSSTSRGIENNIDQKTSECEERRTVEQEEGPTEESKIQEVSEVNLLAVNIEQTGCSSVSDKYGEVTDDNDKIEAQGVVEHVREVVDAIQAESFEESMVDDTDVLSVCTDDGLGDDERKETEKDLYTVAEINSFLDKTKGKVGVEVSNYIPDTEKCIASVMRARKPRTSKGITDLLLLLLAKLNTPCPSKKFAASCTGPRNYLASWNLIRYQNEPDKSLHQLRTAMHHHPRIEKEPSICQSFSCPGRVSFPVLSQIKPQAPLLVVPFCQFL
ncbi:hypothetical protein QQF64_033993 [Cirrhinus molitorella]|uniref:Uncharacterized protein n=1 Tax=Cirrhinus molitorella TaxID=172907 RepID=A0ABR3MVR1_9TELE